MFNCPFYLLATDGDASVVDHASESIGTITLDIELRMDVQDQELDYLEKFLSSWLYDCSGVGVA